MSDIIPNSAEWFHQFHDETINGQETVFSPSSSSFGFSSDATIVTTTNGPSYTCSTTANGIGELIPNNKVNCASKPIRRRSRSSKKIPTTLLNANTSNFRALVQQFTGCRSRATSLIGCQKGPVNLNFQLGKVSVQNHSVNEVTIMAPFSNSTFNYNQYDLRQIQAHQQQQQEQQYMGSFDDVYLADENIETSASGARNNSEMIEDHGLFVDDISLHELARQAFLDQNLDNGYF